MITSEDILFFVDILLDRFSFICHQLQDQKFTIPDEEIERWKFEKKLCGNVKKEDFYCPSYEDGKLVPNQFIFGRLFLAIENSSNSKEMEEYVTSQSLLKPNIEALEIIKTKKIGNSDNSILNMLELYFSNILFVRDYHGNETKSIIDSWKKFSSELYLLMEDKSVDWEKISYCKINNINAMATCIKYIKDYGENCLVYKMPLQTSCYQCKSLYLKDDLTPKIFTAIEMLSHGTNSGRKRLPAKSISTQNASCNNEKEYWKPVAGIVHPWCSCCGPYKYTGYELWARKQTKENSPCS